MSHTVLLADDDAAIRMVLNQALTRAGYEVRPTGNLSTMWNWVSRGEGDLLITDVAMPDGNAFDIMPKIKKLRPDLPVFVNPGHTGGGLHFVRELRAIARPRKDVPPQRLESAADAGITGAGARPRQCLVLPDPGGLGLVELERSQAGYQQP